MKRAFLRSALSILLALALLVPTFALAEDGIEIEANDAIVLNGEQASDEAPEAEVEELTGTLGELPEPSADADAPLLEVVSNAVPPQIELGVKQTYALDAKSLAPGKTITYKTSKSAVAAVSKKGVVTAKKKGKATIRCYAGKTLLATCEVTVVAAPKSVSLGVKSTTLGIGETLRLKPTITKGSLATFTWSTKSKKIATVSKDGLITGKKAGKTTITVKTQNGKKATLTVNVKKAPGKVTLNESAVVLETGDSVQLKATLPKNTYSRITWTSSDESVATVTSKGKVVAVSAGTARITAATFNGKKASCTVRVADDTVKYRALLIGEVSFSPVCYRNQGDVKLMINMLSSVRGLYGGAFSIKYGYDMDRSGVLNAIRTVFADADSNDVSLFFIATHGDTSSSGDYAGALAMVPSGYLKMNDLAYALNAVPGKVIVILESCGAGAAIYANGKGAAQPIDGEAAAKAFDRAAVEAFAGIDPGIVVEVEPNGLRSNGVVSNTGEFRLENKFYVLAASRYQEESYGLEWPDYCNYFTRWLTDGVGTSGSMLADANRDGMATLNELYKYISSVGDNHKMIINNEVYYQHVQVYPANSGYVLFTR